MLPDEVFVPNRLFPVRHPLIELQERIQDCIRSHDRDLGQIRGCRPLDEVFGLTSLLCKLAPSFWSRGLQGGSTVSCVRDKLGMLQLSVSSVPFRPIAIRSP
jgi:hypothetical protein